MHSRIRLQIFTTQGTKGKTGSECTEDRKILYPYILTLRGESQVCPLGFTPAGCMHVHVWVHASSESDPDVWKRNSSITLVEYQNRVWCSKRWPIGGAKVQKIGLGFVWKSARATTHALTLLHEIRFDNNPNIKDSCLTVGAEPCTRQPAAHNLLTFSKHK